MADDDTNVDSGETGNSDADILSFLGGPFYRMVNATAAFVAAFTATAIAQILSGSLLLGCLKWSLLVAFGFRSLQVVLPGDKLLSEGCLSSGFKVLGVLALMSTAMMASFSAIEAGLVQLDGDRAAKAANAERAEQRWRRIGIAAGCYEPDPLNPKKCADIDRLMRQEVERIKNGSVKAPPAARTGGNSPPAAPANR